jgi:preprotein translocase subunit YajC
MRSWLRGGVGGGGSHSVDPGSLLLLAIPVLLLFMITSQNRRRKRETAGVQAALAPGARVMTTSGMYATVTALEGDEITLETAPGQTSRWNRQAVGRVVTPVEAEPAAADDEPPPVGKTPPTG